ncbi:tripartite tricarboxylate transporter substrate binding protein [Comamonas humi]
MSPKPLLPSALLALSLAGACLPAHAAWPDRPVTLVVGFTAGGSADILARTISDPLSRRLGVPVIVDNVAGAGGSIAAQKVVRARPDGYTIFLGSSSEVILSRYFNNAIAYDGAKDLRAVTLVGVMPMVLVAGPRTQATSVDTMLAQAKAQPGKENFASSGMGTALHIAGELINQQAHVSIQHVPYKGAVPMLTDLIGGSVDYGFFMVPSIQGYLKDGKVKPLGTTSKTSCAVLAGVPALSSSKALAGYDFGIWTGIFTPKAVPDDVAGKLNREINAVLREPQVAEKLDQACIEHVGGTQADFERLIRADVQKVRQVATPEIGAVR